MFNEQGLTEMRMAGMYGHWSVRHQIKVIDKEVLNKRLNTIQNTTWEYYSETILLP